MEKTNNYTIGYDIGITSIGWSVIDVENKQLIDQGVRLFKEAESAQSRRIHRSSRRTIRRKKWRKEQFKQALVDFEIVTDLELQKSGYFNINSRYKTKGENKLDKSLDEIKVKTIYHLRKKALEEQVSTREMILALYNIVKTRGHFQMINIDFQNESIPMDEILSKLIAIINKYIVLLDQEKFKKDILIPIIKEEILLGDLKTKLKHHVDAKEDKNSKIKLETICKLIGGWQVKLNNLDDKLSTESTNMKALKYELKNQDEKILEIIKIFDVIQINNLLKNFKYICEYQIKNIEEFDESSKNKNKFEKRKEELRAKNVNGKKFRSVRNLENKFPNGLYIKEAKDILLMQAKYNSKITEEFIEVILSIISAQIPYYVGPLSNNENNNGWLTRTDNNFKYSYNYSQKFNIVDEEKTISDWKQTIRSRCEYLPSELTLPKESLLGEVFVIVNEINKVSKYTRKNISKEEKYKIINTLFLNPSYRNKVTYDDVQKLVGADNLGFEYEEKSQMDGHKFENQILLYFDIIKIVPRLQIKNIEDELITLDDEKSKLNEIEKIIKTLSIYDDYKNKNQIFKKLKYDEQTAGKLASLNTKMYMSFSRRIISETQINEKGETLVELLLSTSKEYTQLINDAVNKSGEKLSYTANKYYKYFESGEELGIDLLIKDGIPTFPISRTVVRALNQALLVHKEIIKEFGHPKKVVIETANNLGDKDNAHDIEKQYEQIRILFEWLKKNQSNPGLNGVEFTQASLKRIEELYKVNKQEIELYLKQGGKDIITGKKINLEKIEDYDLCSILPSGLGFDIKDNHILVERSTNNKMQDKTPIEFIRNTTNKFGTEKAYIRRINNLYKLKLISDKKYELLLIKNQEDAILFLQKNLVDTRYIIKEFGAMLEAYTEHKAKQNKMIVTKFSYVQGSFNNAFRQSFKFIKSRELNSLHHAHDASLVIIIDSVLNKLFPDYSEGNNFSAKRYKQFVEQYMSTTDIVKSQYENYLKKINIFQSMYKNAFNENYNEQNSLVEQIKDNYPRLSYKPERKYTGQLFEETIKPQTGLKNNRRIKINKIAKEYGIKITDLKMKEATDKLISELGEEQVIQEIKNSNIDVLTILNVNNDQRIMSGVECVATDFYKVQKTTDKGKRVVQHYAIQIPKLIVDKNGDIDKEKYLLIIKNHYKAVELLEENGELKEYLFRFRIFKNELIYDTYTNQIKLYNLGSISSRKIEYKPVYFSNYNEEIIKYNILKNSIKVKNENKERLIGKDARLIIQTIVKNQQTFDVELTARLHEIIVNILNENKSNNEKLFKIINKLNYSKYQGAPQGLRQWTLTVNSRVINRSPLDTQYVKIETSPLGIRINKAKDGTLKIEGKHKKIKNNKQISWNVLKS